MATFNQIMFLVLPLAAVLIVLRIPAVRLVYGTDIFDWEATVQTSLVLSAFAVTIPFQAAVSLLSRGFYALHDTRTPVVLSLCGSFVAIACGLFFIRVLSLPAWGLAAAYGVGVILQASMLFVMLGRRVNGGRVLPIVSLTKSLASALMAGGVMFFLLKLFDRSVWMKRISILYFIEPPQVPFQLFVLDTRYTLNLIILVILVSVVGMFVYLATAYALGSRELFELARFVKKRKIVSTIPKEEETIAPSASDTSDS